MKIKILSGLMSLLMVFSVVFSVPVNVLAEEISNIEDCFAEEFVSLPEADTPTGGDSEPTKATNTAAFEVSSEEYLKKYIDVEKFKAHMISKVKSCPAKIDVSAFKIPTNATVIQNVKELIWKDIPELFHVNTLGYSYKSGKVTTINLTYFVSASKYKTTLATCEATANDLVADLKNSNLSDVYKALLIHDRMAALCEYDPNKLSTGGYKNSSYNMDGVLAESVAVCEGYANAYKYLLKKVGIKSYLCISYDLNHSWNIVFIDGKPYHVDVTWDDPTYDYEGKVGHNNFLLSNNGIFNTGHKTYDYVTPATYTTYDNYYWINSSAEFIYLNDEIYYFDSSDKMLKTVSGKNVKSISYTWYASASTYWLSNYTRLATDGKFIYYNSPTGLYRYNPVLNQTVCLSDWDGNSLLSNYNRIFGVSYDATPTPRLHLDVTNNPGQKPKTYYFELPVAPTAQINSTNNLSSSQTLTFNFTAPLGVSGYYFGTNPQYINNSFYSTSYSSVSRTIYQSGTYYLTLKDTQGNLSETYKVTFDLITLDAQGGSVNISSILAKRGNTLTLPDAQKEGADFGGWGKTATATSGFKTITANGNATYYALWGGVKPAKITGIQAKALSSSKINFTFSDVPFARGYQMYCSTTKKYYTAYSSTDFYGLTAGKAYKIRVRAYSYNVDGSKLYGDWSSYFTVKTLPKTPSKPTVSTYGKGSVKVAWKAVSGANGYRLYNSITKQTVYTTSTSYTFKGLEMGKKYAVKVCAYVINDGEKQYTPYSSYLKTGAIPGIKINKTSATIYAGASTTIKPTQYPSSAKVYYKSSKTSVAKVSSSGKITGVKKGTATITAYIKYKGVTYSTSCKVTVKTPYVTVSASSKTLTLGQTYKLSASSTPSAKVYYKTSNKKIATVSSKGTIQAISKGSCTITAYAKYGGKTYSKTCKVTVKSPYVTIDNSALQVNLGDTAQLNAVASNGYTVYYKTSKASVATVSKTGVVTGVGLGTATITAYFKYGKTTYSKTCKVTVVNNKFQEVVDYIKLNGVVNTYGNKLINTTITYAGELHTVAIVYEESEDCLRFITVENDKLMQFDAYLYRNKPLMTVYQQHHMQKDTEYGIARYYLPIIDYTNDFVPNMTVSVEGTFSKSFYTPYFYEYRRLAFRQFNSLLQNHMRLTLNDLGFNNYN